MDETIVEKDLMSLLIDKQRQIRRNCQRRWNAGQDVYLAESEWITLYKAELELLTISELAKRLRITRQASHKIVKGLEEKGLVSVKEEKRYQNRRLVFLTREGKKYLNQYNILKKELVNDIERSIGSENTEQLKAILSIDWGIES